MKSFVNKFMKFYMYKDNQYFLENCNTTKLITDLDRESSNALKYT